MDIIPTQTEGSRGSIYGEDLALERDIFTFIFHPKNLSCRAKKKKKIVIKMVTGQCALTLSHPHYRMKGATARKVKKKKENLYLPSVSPCLKVCRKM